MIFSFLVKWAKKKKTPQVKIILEIDSTNLLGFLGDSDSKESACNSGDLGSIPGLGRSPGEGKGYPLQCSGLENSMDCPVHGVTKSWTRLCDFHFHFSLSPHPPRTDWAVAFTVSLGDKRERHKATRHLQTWD